MSNQCSYIIIAWIEMSRGKAKGDAYVEKVAGKLRKLLICVMINKVVLSRKRIDPLSVTSTWSSSTM